MYSKHFCQVLFEERISFQWTYFYACKTKSLQHNSEKTKQIKVQNFLSLTIREAMGKMHCFKKDLPNKENKSRILTGENPSSDNYIKKC